VNELERIEAQAIRDAVVLGGGTAELAGGAMCVTHPRAPITELNRAIPVGERVDVSAIAEWFGERDHVVAMPPGYPGLEESLRALGYERDHAWMKFERRAEPFVDAPTDLRVEESLDRDAFALASSAGFGMPLPVAAEMSAIVGAPGWHCFVGWAGDEPAACGALYADGETGWVGVGSTRPEFRRRGAQGALLAARIAAAQALGVLRLTTETGEAVDGSPDQSYRNILRAGFREAYLRANWRPAA
jgi:GNAT superfamily N-acetyltransferase